MTVSGALIEYNDKTIVVDTPDAGRLSLDASRFDCVAGDCPKPIDTAAAATEERSLAGLIAIHGTDAIGSRIMPALIRAYALEAGTQVMAPSTATDNVQEIVLTDANGKVAAGVDIERKSEAEAFAALGRGKVDIVMAARPVDDAEVAQLANLGIADMRSPEHEHVLGLDAAAIIVSRSSPVTTLTLAEIADIFAGRVVDWSKLGKDQGKISVHLAKDEHGAVEALRRGLRGGLTVTPAAQRYDTDEEVATAVQDSATAIGVVGMTSLGSARAVAVQLPCELRYEPTPFALKAEEYPFIRRLFLYTARPLKHPHAGGLLEFALSDKAQPILAGIGGADQTVDPLSAAGQGDRIAAGILSPGVEYTPETMRLFLANTLHAQKLSAVFRFSSGSFDLDSRAARDLDRVVAYLTRDGNKGKSVYVLGFSDAFGIGNVNLGLSQRRSDVVRELLLSKANGALDAKRVVSRGFGELMPVSCSDSDDSLARNRRVEIWIK
jgi:phosphate transport system substrate-binding protein